MSISSEEVRLAAAGPLEVTLYTRPGCHLCEEAKAAIAPLLREFQAPLREVNIDLDATLAERYGWDIPVVFIGARKAAKHRVDIVQFRRQLQEASRNCEARRRQGRAFAGSGMLNGPNDRRQDCERPPSYLAHLLAGLSRDRTR